MIEWIEGDVCYAGGKFWKSDNDFSVTFYHSDFQLNEPKEGYYIPKSELDTEEKYNQAVEVFGLFGFDRNGRCCKGYDLFMTDDKADVLCSYITCDKTNNTKLLSSNELASYCKVKLTFKQLMAIGELKRKVSERGSESTESRLVDIKLDNLLDVGDMIKSTLNGIDTNTSESPNISKPVKKRKSKEAYRIIESMGIEWDNVERKWFKVSKDWL